MKQTAFLDTGVVLAYCFTTDIHHYKCRNYIEDDTLAIFISEDIEDAYQRKEPHLTERYSDAVLDHVSDIQCSEYEGQLDSLDIAHIRDDLLNPTNPARVFLSEYYQNVVPNFILLNELQKQLRELARNIEENAIIRKMELDDRLQIWERIHEYPSLDSELDSIHEEDRGVCIDDHDLATNRDGHTELATTDPKDFVRKGHREMIIEVTNLDEVVSLATR